MVGKVLVVDDEDTLRLTIKTRLAAGGFETDAAIDGEEAIEKLKKTPFDVVLLDINMPRMDGMTALGIISEQFPSTDVIMLTGFADFSTAIDCLKKGAKDYLVKPIDTTELITRMRSLLRARNSEAALDSVKKEHASFIFGRVIDPLAKMSGVLAMLAKSHSGKFGKDEVSLITSLEEMANAVMGAGTKNIEAASLAAGEKIDLTKEVSLEKVLDEVSEFASALSKTKDIEFDSNVKVKFPRVLGDEGRLREALKAVVVAAIGIAVKGASVSLGTDTGDKVTVRLAVSKCGEKGKELADQLKKPLDAIGGLLPKLHYDALVLYSAQRTLAAHGGMLTVNASKPEIVFECVIPKK